MKCVCIAIFNTAPKMDKSWDPDVHDASYWNDLKKSMFLI